MRLILKHVQHTQASVKPYVWDRESHQEGDRLCWDKNHEFSLWRRFHADVADLHASTLRKVTCWTNELNCISISEEQPRDWVLVVDRSRPVCAACRHEYLQHFYVHNGASYPQLALEVDGFQHPETCDPTAIMADSHRQFMMPFTLVTDAEEILDSIRHGRIAKLSSEATGWIRVESTGADAAVIKCASVIASRQHNSFHIVKANNSIHGGSTQHTVLVL